MLMFFALYPLISQAQEPKVNDSSDLVAAVNIYNAKIISQDSNKITLSFILSNGEQSQSGIKYAVSLVKNEQDGSQIIIDEKVYDEVVSLPENIATTREIIYEAPEYLSGTYEVRITSQNNKGLALGSNDLGEATFTGNNEYIEIQTSSCQLQVQGEAGETLLANCTIVNNFKTEQIITPIFNTYYPNTFGEKIKTDKLEAITLNPNESKPISLIIPKAEKPQVYDAILSFINNDNKIISNQATFHYISDGASASIQNLRLNKDYYTKGDTAVISLLSLSSADISKINLELTINSEKKACSDTIKQELDSNKQINLETKIIKDCPNPEVLAILKDKDGNVLDQTNFKFASFSVLQTAPEEGVAAKAIKDEKSVIAVLAIICLILIVILVIIIKKRKNSALMNLFVFAIIGAGVIFGGTKGAKGDSFTVIPFMYPCTVVLGVPTTIQANLNKSSYAPGESIYITGSVKMNMPGPDSTGYPKGSVSLLGAANGHSITLFNNSSLKGQTSYSIAPASFTAQATPGSYSTVFSGSAEAKNIYDSEHPNCGPTSFSGRSISYSVQNINPTACSNCATNLTQNVSGNFAFLTSDPLGRSIEYQVDWNNDGTSDASGSGTSGYSTSHSWSTSGTQSYKSRARIYGSNTYGQSYTWTNWTTHSVTIIAPPPVNHAPSTPTISGSNSGFTNSDYNFNVVSTDQDGDTIAYTVDWGDGNSTSYGSYTGSGTAQIKTHRWSSAGTYTIRVQAKDNKGATSASWGTYTIVINLPSQNYPPYTPSITGTTSGNTGVKYNFSITSNGDPDGDQVRFLVDLNNTGVGVAQGNYSRSYSLTISNTWYTAGYYYINVRAEDEHGALSNWASILILMSTPSGGGGGGSPTYSCLNRPQNCSSDCNVTPPTGSNLNFTAVDNCSGALCTCKCRSGYRREGNSCVLITYSCPSRPLNCNDCGGPPPTGPVSSWKMYDNSCPASPTSCNCVCGPDHKVSGSACVEDVKTGECGGAADKSSCKAPSREDLCKSGSPSSVTLEGVNWKWDCVGADGGTTVHCLTNKNCSWTEVNP